MNADIPTTMHIIDVFSFKKSIFIEHNSLNYLYQKKKKKKKNGRILQESKTTFENIDVLFK